MKLPGIFDPKLRAERTQARAAEEEQRARLKEIEREQARLRSEETGRRIFRFFEITFVLALHVGCGALLMTHRNPGLVALGAVALIDIGVFSPRTTKP